MYLPLKKAICVAAFVLIIPRLHAQVPVSADHNPIVPLTPAEMLTLLPAPPTGWDLQLSRATNNFADWLSTESFREYSHPAPASTDALLPDATPPPPYIIRIRILDTGYWLALSRDFEEFKISKSPGGENLMINGFQANITPLGKTGERLRISVKRRFVVQIDALNQPANSAVTWVKLVDLTKLAQMPDIGAEQLPKPVVMTTVDELDPKKNSTSKIYSMSDAEVEAAVKRARH